MGLPERGRTRPGRGGRWWVLLFLTGCQATEIADIFAAKPLPLESPRLDQTDLGIDRPVLGLAPGVRNPSVASDGTRFLVAWTDERANRPGLYAARVDESGALLDPSNLDLPPSQSYRLNPAVAFDGQSYLVVWEEWSRPDSIRGARFSPDGTRVDDTPLALPSEAGGNDSEPKVAFGGTDYLVVWSRKKPLANQIVIARLARSGLLEDRAARIISEVATDQPRVLSHPAVATSQDGYLVTWKDESRGVLAVPVSAQGDLETEPLLVDPDLRASAPTVAYGAGTYLLVWGQKDLADRRSLVARRLSAEGALVGDPVVVTGPGPAHADVNLVFDGANFLVAWSQTEAGGDSDLLAARLTPAGVLLDPQARPLMTIPGDQFVPALASSSSGALVVWKDSRSDGTGVYAVRSASDLTTAERPAVALSRAVNQQDEPVVASDGSGFLTIWKDSRQGHPGLYGAVLDAAGAPRSRDAFHLSDPLTVYPFAALASNGKGYLAIWTEGASTLVARRLDSAGTILGEPIVVSRDIPNWRPPSIAFAAGAYLVLWKDLGKGDLWSRRISEDGSLIDPAPTVVANIDGFFGSPLASDGESFLTVWASDGGPIRGLPLDRDGRPAGESFAISPSSGAAFEPALVFAQGTFVVVWTDLDGIFATRIAPGGSVLDSPIRLDSHKPDEYCDYPRVAYRGADFLVSWTQVDRIGGLSTYAAEMTPTGALSRPARRLGSLNNDIWRSPPVVAGTTTGRGIVAYAAPEPRPGYASRVNVWLSADRPLPTGSRCSSANECTSGFCVDGVCCGSPCPGGPDDCQACSILAGASQNGTCEPQPAQTAGTCRSERSDAGETDGGPMASPPDAAGVAPPDPATTPAHADGGCSCRITRGEDEPASPLLLALCAVALAIARARRTTQKVSIAPISHPPLLGRKFAR